MVNGPHNSGQISEEYSALSTELWCRFRSATCSVHSSSTMVVIQGEVIKTRLPGQKWVYYWPASHPPSFVANNSYLCCRDGWMVCPVEALWRCWCGLILRDSQLQGKKKCWWRYNSNKTFDAQGAIRHTILKQVVYAVSVDKMPKISTGRQKQHFKVAVKSVFPVEKNQ